MLKLVCRKCGAQRVSRVKREGFFQVSFLTFFGFYPWECGSCRTRFLLHNPGGRRRRKPSPPKTQSGPIHRPAAN